jgi:DNA mismatch repair protein MutS
VLRRAREVLRNLEAGELDASGHPRAAYRAAPGHAQLPLFARDADPAAAEVLEALRSLHIEALTPLEALNLLAQLRGRVRPGTEPASS